MKVTVIVPMHNVAPWIEECVASLATQGEGMPAEIIFVDDASTDETLTALANALSKHPRLEASSSVVSLERNVGVSAARREGLLRAKGDYVSFIDADDWVAPTLFEEVQSVIEAATPDVVVFGLVNQWGDRSDIYMPAQYPDAEAFLRSLTRGEEKGYLCNKVFRKSLFTQSAAFAPADVTVWEDKLICCQLATAAKSVVTISKPLYHYRRTRAGSAQSADNGQRFASMVRAADAIGEYFRSHGLEKQLRREYDVMRLLLKLDIMWAVEGKELARYADLFCDADPQLLDSTDVKGCWKHALVAARMGTLLPFRMLRFIGKIKKSMLSSCK